MLAVLLPAWLLLLTGLMPKKIWFISGHNLVIILSIILLGWLLWQSKTVQKKFLVIEGRSFLVLLAIALMAWLLLQTETIQNYIVGKVTTRLTKDLHTEVKVKQVSIAFFNKMNLEGVLVRDKQKDTLLYAGAVKVRITDWFFWKDSADLKYVGLEDAVIKLQRKDSVWNYQFLADYFASPSPKKKKKSGLQLDLKKVDFKNVSFIQNDLWRGELLTVKLGSLLLDAEKIDFNKSDFNISEIELDKPLFSIQDFTGLRPPKPKNAKPVIDTGMYFNQAGISVKIGTIKITNGSFVNEDLDDKHPNTYFDGLHIYANKLNGTINKFSFNKDTIRANIDLAAKERSGFDLKKLKAHFKLTPQVMEFAQLDLRTDKSHLGDYYAMQYKDFNKDMGDYIEKVVMNARFRNSEVSSDDIAYFAPELKSWKKQAEISGKFLGTVANFEVKDLFIRDRSDTYLSGNLSMKGLPDIDKTVISFTNGTLQTTYADAAAIITPIKGMTTPDFAALGKLRFAGIFSGTINDFSTTGNISTAIGGIYANIKMKIPEKTDATYSGTIITKQFNLGKFVQVGSLGQVSFDGKVAGKSFDLNRIKTSIDGTFSQFEFNRYAYANLQFNGTIEKKFFTGEFKANDPNFDFTSNIEIDLKEKEPKFNVLGDLVKCNLKELNLAAEKLELVGLFDLNFRGRNIDEFTGTAKILNASLKHDTTKLNFDSLTLHSYVDTADGKVLQVQSNELDVLLKGQYSILDLPNSFQAFLSHYYPSYIPRPKTTPKNQRFDIVIRTRDFDKYARVIDSRLSGLNNAYITGNINTKDSGVFNIHAEVPSVKYTTYSLSNAVINAKGDFNDVSIAGDVEKIFITDSSFFPNTKINIQSQNDHSVVHISTSANSTLNDAKLNADVYTLPDGVRINFQPSSFVINDKKWDLEKQGEIVITKTYASAKNVKFTQGFQEITVETEDQEGGTRNDLVVKLKDLNIGDFTPLITKKPRLEGVSSGNIYLRDFFNSFKIDADVKTEQFRLDNDSVGVVNVKGLFDSKTGIVTYEAKSDNENYHFNGSGSYNTKDSSGSPLVVNMDLQETKVNLLNEFLDGLFSDITGLATGKLTMKGKPNSPDLLGKVTLKNAGLTVKFTQVHYHVDSAVFNFEDGLIDFGTVKVRDDRNNTGQLTGKLYERGFKNMSFDFDMSTPKLLLLNTTAKDNQQFYGKAIGKGSMSLKGPQEDMKMIIKGEVNDTTHIYIPTSNNKESTEADFIVFKQYGTEMKKEVKDEDTRLSIDLDLTANNKAQIDVILDELTGDVIRATGDGRLQIKVPATGKLTMNGRYNIERGRYDFNFQSIIRKPFDLLPDAGNFIEWNGDPYNANIHIDAQYTASRVSLNDLINNQATTLGAVKGYRGDVYVVAQLRGKLGKPDIGFRFDFPPNSAIKNDPDFALFLNRLQSDDNEMIKQVTYLIVFGSFAAYGQTTTSTSITSISVNTISQKITGELNKLFSNALYRLTGDKSLQFDVGTSTYSSATLLGLGGNTNRLDRQSVNLKINQSLLDGKVIVTFGGDIDFNLSNTSAAQSGNFQWLPDISVQIVLSKDRKLRAVVFSKSSLDIYQTNFGRRNRQGISLSYTRDFEKFFGGKKKPDTEVKSVADKPKPVTQAPVKADSASGGNK